MSLATGLATGEKMLEPAVTSVFTNVHLTLVVYFSSSSKLKHFFLSFEVNDTIFYGNFKRAIIAFKKSVLESLFNKDISIL